ncbi:unnamed protein product [Mycetohabitans rhizoxinica HKI 454]|uniref:Uncharacterized protein n=1 Tax=Mycetohabitans rhizoxinica (strain DSM 19002 / CIP 109453 / HKI 454) TaxID=882378 RepID=E5AN91_MYCRK|nr:unnamed protein product [Mycetohabitans rhizoxinica HKI 454]
MSSAHPRSVIAIAHRIDMVSTAGALAHPLQGDQRLMSIEHVSSVTLLRFL